ncbi:unnamed protein product [Ascophyllum nodosum]
MRILTSITAALAGVIYFSQVWGWLVGNMAPYSADGNVGGPIVAIWAHPSNSSSPECGGSCEFVKAAYVNWLASAGIRSLPIRFNATPDEWEPILDGVNGMLLPGGTPLLPDSARLAIKYAGDMNAGGDFFPVWGTCLGWEWMAQAVAGDYPVLGSGFDAENLTQPWGLFAGVEDTSRMLSDIPNGLLDRARREPITANSHNRGVTPQDFAVSGVDEVFRALAINSDRQGRKYISAAEAFQSPMYGVQWHPEKSQFDWGLDPDGTLHAAVNHSADAVELSQALANFFASEARRSNNAFPFLAEWEPQMFHNRPITPSGPTTGLRYYIKWDDDGVRLKPASSQSEPQ